jgi:hypothetical protein
MATTKKQNKRTKQLKGAKKLEARKALIHVPFSITMRSDCASPK